MGRLQPLLIVSLGAGAWMFASEVTRAADVQNTKGIEFFEKKIRPVLVDHCYQCHSADAQKAKKLKGGLLLDSREGLRKGGDAGPSLNPSKPVESLLLKALRCDGDLKMPPKGKLADTVVADFGKWIEMGAPDPRDGSPLTAKRAIDIDAGRKYWAFGPLAAGNPPPVRNQGWGRTPLDRFILARLEEKNLAPNSAVSREKLIRRASFDLLGLPPTPQEIDAFVKDAAPDAYERLIDRLLQSERYGERWGRHWLDVVRYAESGGYEFDGDRPGAYLYRDFVVKAFNQDMAYDQFVRWQIAGDHLVPGDLLATSATGFLVAGPYPGQTTAKTLEPIRYDHLDDMLATLGTSMLGLSLGCARCHEHKYDPIPQQDYYQLLACLARTDSTQAKIDPQPEIYRKARADFDAAHAPLAAARDRFEKEELPSRLANWLQGARDKPAPAWLILDPVTFTGKTPLQKLADGSLLAGGKAEATDTYTVVAQTSHKGITSIRLEALGDSSLPKGGPGRGPEGNFLLTDLSVTAAPVAKGGKPVAAKLKPGKAPWSVAGAAHKQPGVAFDLDTPVGFDGGTVLTVTLKFDKGFSIGRLRLAVTTAPPPAKLEAEARPQSAWELLAVLHADKGQFTAKNREQALHWFRRLDARTNQVLDVVEQHARKEPQPQLVTVFAATSGRGGDVHYLIRGEVDRKNGVARPGFMQVLMSTPENAQRWLPAAGVEPRVALATWITDADKGAGRLLARVLVNRLWQHHLGRGLVGTPNDFGVQGEAPTHPELLDYLAAELIRNGWKMKPLHKLIMTSAVYLQGGEANASRLQADPQNRLWWRVPPRRLEAESIRDALLAVSGSLDSTMYGPGTLNETILRRSIYLTVKRSQPLLLMQMFDAPEGIQSIGERQATTVAPQALAMMNSPFVRQRAEKLALRVHPKAADDLPQAVADAYLLALSRRPTPTERDTMVRFIRQQADGKALDMALADGCQVLLCLNEFVYVD